MVKDKKINNKIISDLDLEQATGAYTDNEGMVVTPFYSCSSYKGALLPGVAGGCGTCTHMYIKNLIMYCSRGHNSKKL